jgi:hypothetical protein
MNPHRLSRRSLLRRSAALGTACAGYGLTGRLLPLLASPAAEPHPLAARPPHFTPRAKRVILFFLTGGMSHVDSFDPKPELTRRDGQPYGESSRSNQRYVASPWAHRPHGQSGLEITDLFPHIATVADELCLIRSMHGNHSDHFEATLHMHTGSNGGALPGLGAWISHGLGSDNLNLPSHVVFAARQPYAGAQVWDSNFLPAYHQGVRLNPGSAEIIPHLTPQKDNPPALQQAELAMLTHVNRRHLATRGDGELAARTLSFDTAANLQRLAPQLFDLTGESDRTLELYGVKRGDKRSFGWQTLVARRMAESGVRFIELVDTGSSGNWDRHSKIAGNGPLAKQIDQPIAALITDLKERGMLDDTLIICASEFGRTAYGAGSGRNHHAKAFTCWLAGGGVKRGHACGATDDFGLAITQDPVHVHDFHATLLHLLGLDHERLTYQHEGRNFRLTDVFGNVVKDLLA